MILNKGELEKYSHRIQVEDSLINKIYNLTSLRKKGAVLKCNGVFVKRCPHCNTKLNPLVDFSRTLDAINYSYRDCPNCDFEWGSVNGW